LAPVASLVSVHHQRPRAGLVFPVSILNDWVGYHVFLRHGSAGTKKTRLAFGPVTADLTTTVIHSSADKRR